ncbi:histone deacetylase [Malassezia sp. CBS 17886]|nr:histone deacetylase [Malassezia sp. CBS 17886]
MDGLVGGPPVPWPRAAPEHALDVAAAQRRERPRETAYVYDERMKLHATPSADGHPERPERIARIFDMLTEHGCIARMRRIPAREALADEVALVHGRELWDEFEMLMRYPEEALRMYSEALEAHASLYLNAYSTLSARLACGGVVDMCIAVAERRVRNGFAIVRPPGHHAEPSCGTGFCLYNNVAVAARVILEASAHAGAAVRRILIVDWDVHHGNGTQRMFWDDADVLYVSLHRYEMGTFYPGTSYGNYDKVGGPGARGTSLNIPWPCGGMHDADYLYAFQQCIMPVALEYAPDLVIISAGFDAADGDKLGGCHVTPAGYAHMTHQLLSLAEGRVVVALEGGYDLDAISASSLAVARVLLGDAPPPLAGDSVTCAAAVDTVSRVVRTHAPYWTSLASGLPPPAPSPYMRPSFGAVPLREIFASTRAAALWDAHSIAPLPCRVDDGRVPLLRNQALSSSSVLASDTNTVVVYVHDERPLLVDAAHGADALCTTDDSALVADWASRAGYALVDVAAETMLPTRPLFRSENDMSHMRALTSKTRHELTEPLLYVWDNFVTLSSAKRIVLIGHGTASGAVAFLVAHRPVQERVCAIVQLVAFHSVPMMPKHPLELRSWYAARSLVLCARDHPLFLWGEQATAKTRLGSVQRSGACRSRPSVIAHHAVEVRPAELLAAELPRITAWVEARLGGHGGV